MTLLLVLLIVALTVLVVVLLARRRTRAARRPVDSVSPSSDYGYQDGMQAAAFLSLSGETSRDHHVEHHNRQDEHTDWHGRGASGNWGEAGEHSESNGSAEAGDNGASYDNAGSGDSGSFDSGDSGGGSTD